MRGREWVLWLRTADPRGERGASGRGGGQKGGLEGERGSEEISRLYDVRGQGVCLYACYVSRPIRCPPVRLRHCERVFALDYVRSKYTHLSAPLVCETRVIEVHFSMYQLVFDTEYS